MSSMRLLPSVSPYVDTTPLWRVTKEDLNMFVVVQVLYLTDVQLDQVEL